MQTMNFCRSYNFSMSIPQEHYAKPVPPTPWVHINYKIWVGDIITIEWIQFAPNIPENIIDWEGLYKLMEDAAKTHSEDKEKPGEFRRGRRYEPDENEKLFLEQRNSFKQ